MMENKKNNKVVGGVLVLFIGTFIAVFTLLNNTDGEDETISTNPSNEPTSIDEKNGSEFQSTAESDLISSTVSYKVPQALRASINVNISIDDNGVITGVDNTHTAEDSVSASFQEVFEDSIEKLVIGQKIQDVDLVRVGGATLTTDAFMDALNSIEAEIE